MNIKIGLHLMPWELDDAARILDKVAMSKRYLGKDDRIYIDTCLNLSGYIIDWNKSILPKSFFIEKYKYVLNSLYEVSHKDKVYEGDDLYGHLDFQREIIEPHVDYYMSICPDVYFHHHTIYYLIASAKCIRDEYFIITPEIPKLWDHTWDILTNKNFLEDAYSDWENRNIYDIIHVSENISEESHIEKIDQFKWAGWCDLYNKKFYEKLVPTFIDWHGYGPWDSFGINVCNISKKTFNVNVNQYVLRNQVIFDKDIGIFQNKKAPNVYKKYLCLNDIPDQRKCFEANMDKYIDRWFTYAKNSRIL